MESFPRPCKVYVLYAVCKYLGPDSQKFSNCSVSFENLVPGIHRRTNLVQYSVQAYKIYVYRVKYLVLCKGTNSVVYRDIKLIECWFQAIVFIGLERRYNKHLIQCYFNTMD